MGAKITGIGTNKLEIQGVQELKATELTTIPDRIESGTLLIAAAITNGKINLTNSSSEYLDAVLLKLEDSGCKIIRGTNEVGIDARDIDLKPTSITTTIYPGFPTDMQAQWTALMSLVDGVSTVTDAIYFDRFKHVPELNRLGAKIELDRNTAIITGVKKLKGAKVMSTDLRASASLVLAGLAAKGTTEVLRVYHLDRGYQRIEEKLKSLGADIKRVESKEY
jgi:UDP-N-acetylglucosamine 1-carboxyvinyltransferase